MEPSGHVARRRVRRIVERLEGAFGEPRARDGGDLVGNLVRTILSQNTSDVNSDRAYASLRERFADWGAVERAPVSTIESAIRSGGLAKTKAARIRRILRSIRETTGSIDLGFLKDMETPEVLEYLGSFDGVGPKTAACVALFGLGREVVPVDTHVHRVVGRTGVVGTPTSPERTFDALEGLAPDGKAFSLHVNLIRLGRRVCRPRVPDCGGCPIRSLCDVGSGRRSLS
ncbi:MAG: endonuclease III [Candidatus Eisenbacteria bacterium]|nr:endonuclease III [Candidatus Eisenbacteria bacterium]